MKRTVASAALLCVPALFSQSAPQPLTFEVASIKPSDPDARYNQRMLMLQPGGGLRVTNLTLKGLIIWAYDVRDFQISGGPGWTDSARYDIQAKPERSADSDSAPSDPGRMTDDQLKTLAGQVRHRLQALLADRFQLAIHRETREEPVYALLVANSGAKLQEAKDGGNRNMSMGIGHLNGEGVQLQFLAQVLSDQLGRPVLDKTGLNGHYDFKLQWTPGPGEGGGFGPFGAPLGPDAPPPPDPNGASIFTAVQEQLGLRLESTKGPVEIIVVDRAEKASEN
jgi:bla regulator protein blaR1